jgi:hypothetical protein
MQVALTTLFLAAGTDGIADLTLAGAGAGGIWTCLTTFTTDPQNTLLTPIVPADHALVRVVVAIDVMSLRIEIARAISELVTAGAIWIACVEPAGAGCGAAWMAVVLGSNSPKPTPATAGALFVLDKFVATNGQIIFNLSALPANPATVLLFVNGVDYTQGLDFTVLGMVVTWTDAEFTLGAGDIVQVFYERV